MLAEHLSLTGYFLKRLLQALFVVVVVTLLVSWAVRLTGDPSLMLAQGAGSIKDRPGPKESGSSPRISLAIRLT